MSLKECSTKIYTVVAVYEADYQRFAESYEARSASHAESICAAENPGLIIAGVIEGDVNMAG